MMTAIDRHPRHDLDALLTHGVRLSVVAALSQVDRAEFGLVRDLIQTTAPVLSKQVATLEAAHYVEVSKGKVGRQARTWLHLTRAGRGAYDRHLQALQSIAALSPQVDH
jgi:DNA-binding MarR family transcriptional regulator